MTRADPVQRPPRRGIDLRSFPQSALAANQSVYRAHRRDLDPWYFSSDTNGRFNLTEPRGTCYAADSIEIALRERFGRQAAQRGWVSEAVAADAAVSTISTRKDRIAALVSTPQAARYGVTTELSDGNDYAVCQTWAQRLADAGFDAINYTSRFSGGGPANAWAIFGPAGPATDQGNVEATTVGADACAAAGILIREGRARKNDVTIVKELPDS